MLALTSLVTLVLTVLLASETIGNANRLYGWFGFHAYDLVLPAIALLLVCRFKFKVRLNPWWLKAQLYLLPLLVLVTLVLTFYEFFTYTNAAYALTRLHQPRLTLLAIFVTFTTVINFSDKWWHRHWQKVIFLFPCLAFSVLLLTYLFPFNVFAELVKEDRLIEQLQFWVLLIGAGASFWLAKKMSQQRKQLKLAAFFCVIGICFAAVAGDEISWGQRLFKLEVNDTIRQYNHQAELTIHNLYTVEWLVRYAYTALGFIGTLGWLIIKRILAKEHRPKRIYPKLLLGYFALPLFFFLCQYTQPWGIWHRWSEVAELSLYAGVVLAVVVLGYHHLSLISSHKTTLAK